MPRNTHSPQDIPTGVLEAILPGFGLISRFLSETVGLEMTTIVQACALAVALLGAARYAWRALSSLWAQFFMSRITISSTDRLHEQVMSYMSARVVQDSTRSLMAKAGKQGGESGAEYMKSLSQIDLDASIPPTYSPAAGKHRFWYKGHLFVLNIEQRMINGSNRFNNVATVDNEELLTLSCHGRSTQPIKELLLECKRQFADEKREMTTVRSPDSRGTFWRRTTTRLSRPLDSIYLDERVKATVLQDVRDFLHPRAARFYARRGIPYRRGYLFHGAPGTGKTSLSLALAGAFGLELHVLSLSDPDMSDQKLGFLFASLPPRCIVLLEDIDAVGLYRPRALDDPAVQQQQQQQSDVAAPAPERPRGLRRGVPAAAGEHKGVTLSGALNAIDGVASQEGRLLVMTSNDPEALDAALVRPGRVDLQVLFAHVTAAHARLMFERMYTPDDDDETAAWAAKEEDEEHREMTGSVADMADAFAKAIPDARLTPAEVQGFLLARRNRPARAIEDMGRWLEEVLEAKAHERNILKKAT